jgi:hypothetical protein
MLLLWICAFALRVVCQSPGPDWPNCAHTSLNHHPGWDILSFSYRHPAETQNKPARLDMVFRNHADGSRTDCSLSKDTKIEDPAKEKPFVITNADGTCMTAWVDKYRPIDQDTIQAPIAEIAFNPHTSVISVRQTWTCRNSTGQL